MFTLFLAHVVAVTVPVMACAIAAQFRVVKPTLGDTVAILAHEWSQIKAAAEVSA